MISYRYLYHPTARCALSLTRYPFMEPSEVFFTAANDFYKGNSNSSSLAYLHRLFSPQCALALTRYPFMEPSEASFMAALMSS